MGFKFITQLNGGTKTDFDYPHKKTKFLEEVWRGRPKTSL